MVYYNYKEFDYISDTSIKVEDIKRILSECKIIDIANKEELPKGKVIFVGVGNNKYEWRTLYDLEYTVYGKYTYGGYFNEDHKDIFHIGYRGYSGWWTMNCCDNDLYDKTKIYVLSNELDAEKLTTFLNYIYGLNNLRNSIYQIEEKIKKLQNDADYLKQLNKLLNKN